MCALLISFYFLEPVGRSQRDSGEMRPYVHSVSWQLYVRTAEPVEVLAMSSAYDKGVRVGLEGQ